MLPVCDLHCDLLAYLAHIGGADALNPEIGCALPLLESGNVRLQTLAIFATTGNGSVESAFEQIRAFEELQDDFPDAVQTFNDTSLPENIEDSDALLVVTAFENASCFCGEDDGLDEALETFEFMLKRIAPVLYVSLTHNEENRFGGGNDSDNTGLKDDGRILLDYLSGRRIAVDLSHTGDALARDVLEHIDAQRLDLPVIASHSNFRAVHNHRRNLPDDIAQEIIRRGGLIGMNFCHEFVHEYDSDVLFDHILHGFRLGGGEAIAFGSDFFFAPDEDEFFYDHRNSAQFPYLLGRLADTLDPEDLAALASGNVMRFLRRIGL